MDIYHPGEALQYSCTCKVAAQCHPLEYIL